MLNYGIASTKLYSFFFFLSFFLSFFETDPQKSSTSSGGAGSGLASDSYGVTTPSSPCELTRVGTAIGQPSSSVASGVGDSEYTSQSNGGCEMDAANANSYGGNV